jgi:hypothetical protein
MVLGILAVGGALVLLAMPFSAGGAGCGTALTPHSLQVGARVAAQDPEVLVDRMNAQRECDSGVRFRRLSGAPLVILGIAAITIGATPRWRRRHRSRSRRRRHSSRPHSPRPERTSTGS